MGLIVSSIARLPIATDRDYFVYFLDYGWEDPLSQAMYDNFDKMAAIASESRGLIIQGLDRKHFTNEVLNWHSINGEDASDILPAIMITDTEPRKIADSNKDFDHFKKNKNDTNPIENMIIIPLRAICNTPSDVVNILSKIADDIKEKKSLGDFEVKRLVDKTQYGFADMVILKPSFAGVGIDLVKAIQIGKKYWSGLIQKKSSL